MCTICQSACVLEHTPSAVALPCGHVFHADCLVPWLWKRRMCPNCRLEPTDAESSSTADQRQVYAIVLVPDTRRSLSSRQQRLQTIHQRVQRARSEHASAQLTRRVARYDTCRSRVRCTRDLLRDNARAAFAARRRKRRADQQVLAASVDGEHRVPTASRDLDSARACAATQRLLKKRLYQQLSSLRSAEAYFSSTQSD